MLLELQNICKSYGEGKYAVPILHDICFQVEKGEYVAIMGPSGSGKSTLMNIIGCLDVPTSGSYFLDGKEISKCTEDQLSEIRNKKLGFVFQNFNLLPRETALENVALPMLYGKVNRKERLAKAEKVLEATEQVIHHKADPVPVLGVVDVGTAPSVTGNVYFCGMNTKITAAMLQNLDDTDQTVEFRIYENNVQVGAWLVDGAKMSSGEKTIYIEKTIIITPDPDPDPVPTPGPDQPDDPSEDNAQPTAALTAVRQTSEATVGSRTEEETRREEQAPYQDWVLGEGVVFNGDGTVSVDYSQKHYGQLSSVVPEEAEWDETIIIQPDVDTSGENYVYSRKELAEMIQEKSKELEDKELELKEANLKLEEDKLVSTDGRVLAGMDGVVTEVKDPTEAKPNFLRRGPISF